MIWVIVAGWLMGWALLWRLPTLPTASGARIGRRLSVVIPMRNEADRIGRLLASLERQRRRPDQIVVVDDGSRDGSAEAARAFQGVEVVAAGRVPDGWTGKSWACATGARVAHGELLVFLDADVVLGEDAIGRLVGASSQQGGLVSVQPHHRIERPFESVSLLFNVVAMMGLGVGSLVRPRHEWGAAGPCLVTSRADYDRIGGHGAVAGELAEDLALAGAYRRAGLPVHCFAGSDQLWFRMYRTPHDLFQGWGKNLATGAGRTPRLRALAIALWVTALLSMVLAIVSAARGTADLSTAAVWYAAGALQVGILGSRVGRFGWAAVVWPVLVVCFVTIFAWSAVRTLLLRQVVWSGRSIPLHPQKGHPR